MAPTRLVVVGGFLGSGKTTLLWKAARRLQEAGREVGLVTNDQAPDLVDTALLSQEGLYVREVVGACFCCNFHALMETVENMRTEGTAEIILAEPLGSCADISATLLQPLRASYSDRYSVGPFSVLTDAVPLRDVLAGLDGEQHPDVAYIFRKQLEEADIIVVNKIDELGRGERRRVKELLRAEFPEHPVHWLSALEGKGVDEWLGAVKEGESGGARTLQIDYDRYSRGERALGWLNAVVRIRGLGSRAHWPTFCSELLESLRSAFRAGEVMIGHLKVLLSTSMGYCVGNVTGVRREVSVQSAMRGVPPRATATLNARVAMAPSELEDIVRESLDATAREAFEYDIEKLESFSPARPEPTFGRRQDR